MIRKLKLISILIMMAVVACCFVACTDSTSEDDRLRNLGYTVEITFDANGGSFDTQGIFKIFVKPNSAIPMPSMGRIPSCSKQGFSLAGWYRGEVDQGGALVLGSKWDFSSDLATENITLYAVWQHNFVFRFVWENEDGLSDEYVEVSASSGKLETKNQTLKGLRATLATLREGYSLLAVYTSEEMREEDKITDFTAVTHQLNSEEPAKILYTKWIEGRFVFVGSAEDMKPSVGVNNFYLEANVDFNNKAWLLPENYTGKIIGNGFTISNLLINYTDSRSGQYFGIFASLFGEISNVTFSNCRVEVVFTSQPTNEYVRQIGFIAGLVADTAQISEVVLTGCEIEVVQQNCNVVCLLTPANNYYYYLLEAVLENNAVTGVVSATGDFLDSL